MKNNRLILTIIFMAVTFCFLMPTDVKASDYNAYTPNDARCLKDGDCMIVCQYTNDIEYRNKVYTNYLTLYYGKNKKWTLSWTVPPGKVSYHNKGPDSIKNVFSTKGLYNVYVDTSINADSFTCPKNGYIDYNTLVPGNEICFDKDDKYCKKKSNAGTDFGTNTDKFKGKKKTYDFEKAISQYFSKDLFSDMPCEELASINSTNINQKLAEKVESDFKEKFTNGRDIPTFILTNPAYKSSVKSSVNNRLTTCDKEITQLQNEGKLDPATGERWKHNLRNIDPDKVQDAVDDARDKMADDSNFDLSDYNQPQDCKSIFGDPTEDKESLAYLIQTILNYIKVIGPILVVLLSSFDFVKVIWTSDDENMKKAQQKLAKRLVAAVLLFLLPLLIEIMFNLINDSIVDPTCGIK